MGFILIVSNQKNCIYCKNKYLGRRKDNKKKLIEGQNSHFLFGNYKIDDFNNNIKWEKVPNGRKCGRHFLKSFFFFIIDVLPLDMRPSPPPRPAMPDTLLDVVVQRTSLSRADKGELDNIYFSNNIPANQNI